MRQPLIKQPKGINSLRGMKWKAALAEYMNTWKEGDLVQYGGSKWTVTRLSDHDATLESGSIQLFINLYDRA